MGRVLFILFNLILIFEQYILGQANSRQSAIPDTLYISNGSSTYLAFPKEIDLINIGSPDYIFQVEKTMVYLKAIRPLVKPTNLFIKCSNGILVMNLVFQSRPKTNLYDFRNINFDLFNPKLEGKADVFPNIRDKARKKALKIDSFSPKSDSLLKDTSSFPFGISINRIQSSPDRFKTFGTAQNLITILLTNIFTDTKRMILKFKIINRSSINYELDYVSFQFRRRTHYSQNTLLSPLYSSPLTSCGPRNQLTLVYILPLFGTATNGDFSVTFRELNGDRKETIEIPERAFKMAELL